MNLPCLNCGKTVDRINKQSGYPATVCRACHNESVRSTRKKYADLSPEEKLKASARAYAKVYKRRGKLIPQPCESCGAAASECQMHHPDYSKPLEVKWLCVACHELLHHGPPRVAEGVVKRGSWRQRWYESPEGKKIAGDRNGRKDRAWSEVRAAPGYWIKDQLT